MCFIDIPNNKSGFIHIKNIFFKKNLNKIDSGSKKTVMSCIVNKKPFLLKKNNDFSCD